MGVQLVVTADTPLNVERALGQIAPECEIFPMAPGRIGLSVPTHVVDKVGEEVLRKRIAELRHFDLWQGQWSERDSSERANGG